jgi:hypothetical protein
MQLLERFEVEYNTFNRSTHGAMSVPISAVRRINDNMKHIPSFCKKSPA